MSEYGQGFTPPPDDNDPQQDSPPPNDPYGQNPYGQQGGIGQNPYGNPQDPYGQMDGVPLNAQGYRSTGNIYTWQEVWRLVLTQPSEETFEEIMGDPDRGMNRSLIWLFAALIVSGLASLAGQVVQSILGITAFGLDSAQTTSIGVNLLCSVILLPICAAVLLMLILLWFGIVHLLARAFGGNGDFDDTLYSLSASFSPLWIIYSVVSIIPIVNIFAFIIIGLYNLVLQVMAVKVIHRFEWLQAFGAVIGPIIILFIIPMGCCMLFFFTSIMAAVGN